MGRAPYQTARKVLEVAAAKAKRPEIGSPIAAALHRLDEAQSAARLLQDTSDRYGDAMEHLKSASLALCDAVQQPPATGQGAQPEVRRARDSVRKAAELEVSAALHVIESGIITRRVAALVTGLLENRILGLINSKRRSEVVASTGEIMLALTGLVPVIGVPASLAGAVLQLLDAVSDTRIEAVEDMLDRIDLVAAALSAWTSLARDLSNAIVESTAIVVVRTDAMGQLARSLELLTTDAATSA